MKSDTKNPKSRVTIKDVAREAGVSIATVSYVLNNKPGQSISEDTRKKVLQFANLLGYRCNVMARYLATGKTNNVAAVIKEVQPFASQYYLKLLAELSRLLCRKNFDLRLVDYDDGLTKGNDCDAFITIGLSENDFHAFADTKYVPVIALDSVIDDFLFFRINDDFVKLREKAQKEFGSSNVTLLTFAVSDGIMARAKQAFDNVAVVRDLDDISALDRTGLYTTVSSSIYDNAVKFLKIRLESASFALKASALAEAAVKAIEHTHCTDEEHDIRI